MDLLALIQRQVGTLPSGPYLAGLQSVLRHIETAYRHLSRGQLEPDETAFTDAIYRTNQAFEGSIKEAYRVLAGKDPSHVRPFDIETYLHDNAVFRPRVLTQFKSYRQEWRNPSAHDYILDFDEDEAFLAIVSVSAFTKLLVDQIAETAAFNAVKKDAQVITSNLEAVVRSQSTLAQRLSATIVDFFNEYQNTSSQIFTELQLLGALSAYISLAVPDARIDTEVALRESGRHYADMVVKHNDSISVIELKSASPRAIAHGLRQLESNMLAANADSGLLVLFSTSSARYYIDTRHSVGDRLHIAVVSPDNSTLDKLTSE